MKSSIKIIDTGFYTSIQDNGRFGYRGIGVPVSGPMDYFSFNKANSLVENYNYEALLESTFRGPKILFSGNCKVAVTGAEVVIKKNDELMKLNEPFLCELGDVLDIGVVKNGFRNYISFRGGLTNEKKFGSYSQYYPITSNGTVAKGQNIFLKGSEKNIHTNHISTKKMKLNNVLEVYQGPFWNKLDNQLKNKIEKSEYRIGSNNRMAYILTGIGLKNEISTHSRSVIPGTVQLTPNGELIIVMRDGQVTGGYPRILQLTENSQSKLAQLGTGKLITFKISVQNRFH